MGLSSRLLEPVRKQFRVTQRDPELNRSLAGKFSEDRDPFQFDSSMIAFDELRPSDHLVFRVDDFCASLTIGGIDIEMQLAGWRTDRSRPDDSWFHTSPTRKRVTGNDIHSLARRACIEHTARGFPLARIIWVQTLLVDLAARPVQRLLSTTGLHSPRSVVTVLAT